MSAPSIDKVLTVVGFPLSLGVKGLFSPIIKMSHSASEVFSYSRFDSGAISQVFILDDPSTAGFSGAPVYQMSQVHAGVMQVAQGEFKIVGLVHGSYADRFAAIVPAVYILEALREAK